MKELIEHLRLEPHPEGGYYREYYRSTEEIETDALPVRFTGTRSIATAIYFLLPKGECSLFHVIKSDEIWVHIAGGTLEIHELHPSFGSKLTLLGPVGANDLTPSHVVPAGNYFGSRPAADAEYVLVSCIVAPGFDFEDFEIPERNTLLDLFPEQREIITELSLESA